MADKTGIEWTDATWNPTTGCDRVSPGCDNCYALTMAKRLKAMGSARYERDGDSATSGPGFGLTMHPDALDQPLRWKRPRRIFVNSMSDLFHAEVTDEFLARVFAVMALTPQHTFQILTKRHGRMRSLMSGSFRVRVLDAAYLMAMSEDAAVALPKTVAQEYGDRVTMTLALGQIPQVETPSAVSWPLPNVVLGVSVEDQKWAGIRIPALQETRAAVRFLSCEPLLGSIPDLDLTGIGWVIVGGESGRGSRPMRADWARVIRDQCTRAGVPFLFKQWGNHDEHGNDVGKHAAGRLLDGRTWDEYPTVGAA